MIGCREAVLGPPRERLSLGIPGLRIIVKVGVPSQKSALVKLRAVCRSINTAGRVIGRPPL